MDAKRTMISTHHMDAGELPAAHADVQAQHDGVFSVLRRHVVVELLPEGKWHTNTDFSINHAVMIVLVSPFVV